MSTWQRIQAPGSPMEDRVRAATEFMDARMREPLTLSRIAREVGVGRDRLLRLFRRDTGQTPVKALRNMRFREAARLLSTTGMALKEVAAAVGIADLSHFERDFKAIHGTPPGRYRVAHCQSESQQLSLLG